MFTSIFNIFIITSFETELLFTCLLNRLMISGSALLMCQYNNIFATT